MQIRVSRCDKCCRAISDLLRCSRCKKVRYCSELCQKNDWPEHKKVCKLLQLSFQLLDELNKTPKMDVQTFVKNKLDNPETADQINELRDVIKKRTEEKEK